MNTSVDVKHCTGEMNASVAFKVKCFTFTESQILEIIILEGTERKGLTFMYINWTWFYVHFFIISIHPLS